MKLGYLKPSIKELKVFDNLMDSTSGVTGDNGVGFGGVDNGTRDPEAKQYIPDEFRSVWSD